MVRFAAVTAFTAMLLLPAPAFAEDWQFLIEAENGVVFSIDRDSIRDEGEYRQAWMRSDYSNSNVMEDGVIVRRSLQDFDCVRRLWRPRASVAYGIDGNVIRRMTLNPEEAAWRAVEEGSIGETKLEALCPRPGASS